MEDFAPAFSDWIFGRDVRVVAEQKRDRKRLFFLLPTVSERHVLRTLFTVAFGWPGLASSPEVYRLCSLPFSLLPLLLPIFSERKTGSSLKCRLIDSLSSSFSNNFVLSACLPFGKSSLTLGRIWARLGVCCERT